MLDAGDVHSYKVESHILFPCTGFHFRNFCEFVIFFVFKFIYIFLTLMLIQQTQCDVEIVEEDGVHTTLIPTCNR